MNSKLFKYTSLVVLLSAVLSGCSALDQVVPDNTLKYRKADTMPPLDVPPDLSSKNINDNVGGTQDSTATYSEYEEQATNPLAAKYNIKPDQKPALAGEGQDRHLMVPEGMDITWQRIEKFWGTKGINIYRQNKLIGLMDTDADKQGYAYRVRVEHGDTSKMTDVYVSGRDEKTRDPQKDESMLRDLANYLGVLYQKDVKEMQAQQRTESPQDIAKSMLIDEPGGQEALMVQQDYPTVWRRVGSVLDSKGFAIENQDRAQGYYLVKYVDPFLAAQQKDESLWDKIAFWKDDSEKKPDQYYYIKLISDAEKTKIIILDAKKVRTSSDSAKRLLGLIQEQLNK